MQTKKMFIGKDFWAGGDFGLLVSYPNGSSQNIKKLLNYLWNWGILDGPYHSNQKEPKNQLKSKIQIPTENFGPTDYGVISLPRKKKAPCSLSSYILIGTKNHYFIHISIPMGALDGLKIYPVGGYPFGTHEDHSKWIKELSGSFLDFAKEMFKIYKFQRAIIGYFVDDEKFLGDEKYKIPRKRYIGYLINEYNKIKWYPPNVFSGQFN